MISHFIYLIPVYIYQLRTDPDPIDDQHNALKSFCEILEAILRKGLKREYNICNEFGYLIKSELQIKAQSVCLTKDFFLPRFDSLVGFIPCIKQSYANRSGKSK